MNITSRIYKWRVCSPGSDVERTRIKRGFLLLTFWREQRLGKIAAHNFSWEGMKKKWPVAFSRRPFSWVPASLRFIKSSLFSPDIWTLLRTNLVITWLHWLPGDSLITLRFPGIAVGINHSIQYLHYVMQFDKLDACDVILLNNFRPFLPLLQNWTQKLWAFCKKVFEQMDKVKNIW